MPKLAFFTAGTIGAGHLARGIAIERALARVSSKAHFTIVGPPSPFTIADRPSCRAVAMDPMELYDHERATTSQLAETLVALAPDVLVVDMFWAPLLHVLPLLAPRTEAWLLVRKVPADWFTGPPGHRFDRAQYARILAIEPGLDGNVVDEVIDPIVLVRPEEAKPPGSLRRRLGLANDAPLVVVEHTGSVDEQNELVAHAHARMRTKAPLHVFTPSRRAEVANASTFEATHHDGATFFPLAEWLGDADEIVTGAGYNAYWETRLLGLDSRTVYLPFARPLDDQAWRVEAHRAFVPRDNGADTLVKMLAL